MDSVELTRLRLFNQHIGATKFTTAAEIVRWFGAVQSQDYYGAKWAMGLRLPGSKDAEVEQAFNDGGIIRTHILRPTWHFVDPADIRWMMGLTSPRINPMIASQHRKVGIDAPIIKQSNDIICKALEGRNYLQRDELAAALHNGGVNTEGLRLTHLVIQAEIDGLICSGPRRGKQFTYALIDERVPPAEMISDEEALAKLTRLFFNARGPATIRDFAWWSGLALTVAKAGFESVRSSFETANVDGAEYHFSPVDNLSATKHDVRLLPNFDEFVVAYQNRAAIFEDPHDERARGGNLLFNHLIVVDGKVAGIWKAPEKGKFTDFTTDLFRQLTKTEAKNLENARARYFDFSGRNGR